jgi:hypothetical protein
MYALAAAPRVYAPYMPSAPFVLLESLPLLLPLPYPATAPPFAPAPPFSPRAYYPDHHPDYYPDDAYYPEDGLLAGGPFDFGAVGTPPPLMSPRGEEYDPLPGPAAPEGDRRALLIGINYTGQRNQLRGCHDDVRRIEALLLAEGWGPEEIRVVTDSPESPVQPTYEGLLAAFRWLSGGTAAGDARFLHFSGHGGSVPAHAGTLKPGPMEQTMIPVDHNNGRRQLRGSAIHAALVAPLPPGSRLTIVMDCCHSGAVIDLPYQFLAHQFEMTKYYQNGRRLPGARPFRSELDRSRPFSSGLRLIPQMLAGRLESVLDGPAPMAEVVMLSSCKDWQLSADIKSGVGHGTSWDAPEGGDRKGFVGGALTFALLTALNETGPYPAALFDLLERMRQLIRERGLMQVPQLSASAVLDLEAPFTLEGPLASSPPMVFYSPY